MIGRRAALRAILGQAIMTPAMVLAAKEAAQAKVSLEPLANSVATEPDQVDIASNKLWKLTDIENGVVGYEDDEMPTRWMPLPEPPREAG